MGVVEEGVWAPQLTPAFLHRWLLPPQALNAYYLPNKNQMGKGVCPNRGRGLEVGGSLLTTPLHSIPGGYPAAHAV